MVKRFLQFFPLKIAKVNITELVSIQLWRSMMYNNDVEGKQYVPSHLFFLIQSVDCIFNTL